MKRLRIGVVGVGVMGRRHVEKVMALRAAGAPVELVGVADVDGNRCRQVAQEHRTWAPPDADRLFRECDAAIVAVPTVAHEGVVAAALAADLDVLVEKPIAFSTQEATALLALAAERGRVLRVGHSEWFNPATRVLRDQVQAPRFVDVQRLGPFPARGTDVDVVRDLMIHDIDILQRVLGEEPAEVVAVGVPVVTDKVDLANARLRFPSGCIANLTVSRIARQTVRKMRLFERDAFFSVDFLRQRARIHRRGDAVGKPWPEIETERVEYAPEDALLMQLRAFVDDVEKRDVPTASARAATAALRTALRVVSAIESQPELG
ncbi:MAG: Gfo/Idh/MocA family oxidoreductase [Myxococcota bacterium]|nr:Gfo/Idh/MocA family oxidoreductase [Myxococcota bacterium]